MRFVDRERELRELRAIAQRGESALLLLYGRRRVGKTFLLDHAWPDMRSFYFLAGDTTDQLNKRDLLSEVSALLPEPADAHPDLFPSWRHVFRLFASLAEEEPFVVVLDEFQYLLNREEDIASQLMAVWDRELRGRPLILVACGSEVGTMRELEQGSGPLYGRWTWAARLRPFDYLDAGAMVPHLEPREQALTYGIFGGTPRYLGVIRPGDDLSQRAIETFLSPRGEVHLQLDRVIEQEKGIRETTEYRAVLTAIATGSTLLADIAATTGLQDRVHVVRRAVEVLEDLELVSRDRNFEAHPKAPFRFRIADNALRFWHRFVVPHRSRLESGDAAPVWHQHIKKHLNEYMDKVFEDMCGEAYTRAHDRWGYPAATSMSRWEGTDRNRRSIELDLVARLADGRVLTGEIKWSSKPVGQKVHDKVTRDLEDLANSGHGWAKDALATNRTAGRVYFSAAGFDQPFLDVAAEDPSIRLISLEDLYRV